MDFGIVEWVNGEPDNIAEGKADVAGELGTVNRILKGLFIQKS